MKYIKLIVTILLLGIVFYYRTQITDYIASLLEVRPKVVIDEPNQYYREYKYAYVKNSEDFIPYSYQDIQNIFYSILNRGYDKFTFYCPKEYTDCLSDVEKIIDDKDALTNINNFVNPFNGFSNIKVIYSTTGEVNVEITKLYTIDQTNSVIKRMNEIKNEIYKDDMKIEDKILAIHDYIINHTRYDEKRKSGESTYFSNIAYGSLIEGYAVCGGYADAMALFLDELNIPNFKVSSKTHVWNAVYINDKWLHLDLTWDDPVTLNSDKQTLTHKFYLIDTKALEAYQITDHEFNKTIYEELS